MALLRITSRRGGSYWAHGGVTGRLLGITKRRARFLALHPMALRRWREISICTPR